jgi:alkylation response protein AidB-like acyl-CoA dehydrogenase
MTTQVGLDRDTLDMMLSSLDAFVAEALPDHRRLDLDHEDVCPKETIRAMCGEGLGVRLVFIPEEYGGLDERGRYSVRRLVYRSPARMAASPGASHCSPVGSASSPSASHRCPPESAGSCGMAPPENWSFSRIYCGHNCS